MVFGALQQDQRRGRPGPVLYPPVVRGALGDPAGRRPGKVLRPGPPIRGSDGRRRACEISTKNRGPLRGERRDSRER